jgi:hypothetical protein
MNCREYEADVVDLARGAELSAAAAERAAAHLEHCAGCAARFERERQMTTALKAVADFAPASSRAAVIEEQLIAAFAARQATAVREAPASRSRLAMPAAWGWLAAAAVLVLAVAVWQGTAWWRVAEPIQPGSTRVATDSTAQLPANPQALASQPSTAPAGTETSEGSVRAMSSPPDAARAPVAAPRARVVRDRARLVEPASDDQILRFVSLPTAIGLPALESGRIVRVEVPAAMLPVYGLDVTPDSQSGTVEADVLVGQDGQPRAIRFVTLDSDSRRRQ